jgi:hypothetical protein
VWAVFAGGYIVLSWEEAVLNFRPVS